MNPCLGYTGNAEYGCTIVRPPTNPCQPNPCGIDALCEVDNGNPICSCARGKTGNPFVRCIPDGDRCPGNQCGPNSGCRMVADRPVCYCLPRFEGAPPAIPCMKPSKQCKPNPCGENTECVVINNVQRCTCKPGYKESINTIQVNIIFKLTLTYHCNWRNLYFNFKKFHVNCTLMSMCI